MKSEKIVIRSYAMRRDGLWVAICVDLSLAAQGDTLEEVRRKLDAQIDEYMEDALSGGIDNAHCEYLLTRKAPLSNILTYHAISMVKGISSIFNSRSKQPRAEILKHPLKTAAVC
jgi:predicted RNase H-like HicB family nuclease